MYSSMSVNAEGEHKCCWLRGHILFSFVGVSATDEEDPKCRKLHCYPLKRKIEVVVNDEGE